MVAILAFEAYFKQIYAISKGQGFDITLAFYI